MAAHMEGDVQMRFMGHMGWGFGRILGGLGGVFQSYQICGKLWLQN
jgi:hypothetical protein